MREIPTNGYVLDVGTNEITLVQLANGFTDNIPVGTYMMQVGPDGNPSFTFASQRFLDMFDLKLELVLTDAFGVFACVHPEDHDAFVALNLEVFAKGLPFYWEGRCVVRGAVIWVIAESIPRKLDNGVTVWEGSCTDITRQKIAEERLRESELNLRKLIESSPTPTAHADLKNDGQIYFVNQKFAKTFGYTSEDLHFSKDWFKAAYPDKAYRQATEERWAASVAEALRTDGRIAEHEYKIRCKNGDEKDVLISGTVIDDQLVVSFVDLTERNRAQAELAKAREEIVLQQIEDSKLTERLHLVNDVHDGFGSQLTSAGLRVESGEMSQADTAALLQECITDLHLLVDALSESDRTLREALVDFRYRTSTRLAEHPIQLTWDLAAASAKSPPPRVTLQVLRIVQEALTNALKHAEASEVHISATGSSSGTLTIEVRDNGRGLPSAFTHGKGVRSMQSRALHIGAELCIEPVATGGTRVSLQF